MFLDFLSNFPDQHPYSSSSQLFTPPFYLCSLCSGNPVVKTAGDRFRDTAALTVRADGKDLPPFFIKGQVGNASKASGRRPKRGEKAVGGMNAALMKKYAKHISHYPSKPSLLLLDRASSHTSKKTIAELEDYLTPDGQQMFKVILIPPKAAFLVSPLDNGVIASFKQHFYRFDRSTFELKKSSAKLAWDAVSNDAIKNICRNCGLDPEVPISTIREKFEKNVHGLLSKKLKPFLQLYDQWKAGAIVIDGADLGRGVAYSRPTQLDDGTLDGIKWIEWNTESS
jgi:hypothetical protein